MKTSSKLDIATVAIVFLAMLFFAGYSLATGAFQ